MQAEDPAFVQVAIALLDDPADTGDTSCRNAPASSIPSSPGC